MNSKNNQIRSVVYENLSITASKEMSVQVHGKLAYQKDKRFRLIYRSAWGPEADIGSNDHQFWFWSRRMSPPALFYADHKDTTKTPLKPQYHPMLIAATLGINHIDLEDTIILKYQDKVAVLKQFRSTLNSTLIKTTIIDPDRQAVVAQYLMTASGSPLMSTEVKEFYIVQGAMIPKVIYTYIDQDEVFMIWELGQPVINSQIDPSIWIMPKKSQMIDLKDYRPSLLAIASRRLRSSARLSLVNVKGDL